MSKPSLQFGRGNFFTLSSEFLNALLLTLEKIHSARRQNWIVAVCDPGEAVTAELRTGSSVHLLFLL